MGHRYQEKAAAAFERQQLRAQRRGRTIAAPPGRPATGEATADQSPPEPPWNLADQQRRGED